MIDNNVANDSKDQPFFGNTKIGFSRLTRPRARIFPGNGSASTIPNCFDDWLSAAASE